MFQLRKNNTGVCPIARKQQKELIGIKLPKHIEKALAQAIQNAITRTEDGICIVVYGAVEHFILVLVR